MYTLTRLILHSCTVLYMSEASSFKIQLWVQLDQVLSTQLYLADYRENTLCFNIHMWGQLDQ